MLLVVFLEKSIEDSAISQQASLNTYPNVLAMPNVQKSVPAQPKATNHAFLPPSGKESSSSCLSIDGSGGLAKVQCITWSSGSVLVMSNFQL